MRFRLKPEAQKLYPDLTKDFDITLYPNSVFLMSLETNRLYTHEIIPSDAEAVTFISSGSLLSNKPEEHGKVNIYPNPSDNILHLELSGFFTPVLIQIMDISGRVLLQEQLKDPADQRFTVNIEHLEKGIYIVG